MQRLQKDFYTRPATIAAPELLGKMLCRRMPEGIQKKIITETECYFGADDTACHAKRGITPGNQIIFAEGGVSYVYLCYGLHYLFNVVTGCKGHGEGVLIRGIENAKGPGLVTKALNIDKTFNGHDLCISDLLWIEDAYLTPDYVTLPRVGIDYAEPKDRERLWRFVSKLSK